MSLLLDCYLGNEDEKSDIRDIPNIKASDSMILPSSPGSLDLGTTTVHRTSTMAREESYCLESSKWYYMWLPNEDLKKYFCLLTGAANEDNEKQSTSQQTVKGKAIFKCFAYTPILHQRRNNCKNLSEEDYSQHLERYKEALNAFDDQNPAKFNALTEVKNIIGDGYLFINADLAQLTEILRKQMPVRHLVKNHNTGSPACIPEHEIKDFFILFEILPYNIQLLEHPLSEYTVKQKRIRFTGGIFQGQEARVMRLHRSMRIVFELSNMTLSMRHTRIFPYEIIEE